MEVHQSHLVPLRGGGYNHLVEIQYVLGSQRCLPGNILGSVSSTMMVLDGDSYIDSDGDGDDR